MRSKSAIVVLSCLCTAPLAAQLRLSELSLDPVGPNAGNQIVEIVNPGTAPVTIPQGWSMCIRPVYPPMPQVTIPPGGIVAVHIGGTGTNTATDWYVPGISLGADAEIALYRTDVLFDDPTLIMDFASWGQGAAFTRIVAAIQANLWPSMTTHLVVPPEGHTLAWLGSGNGPTAWYADTTPTLGAPNRAASNEPFASGCAGTVGVPALGPDPAAPLPWLGAPFATRVTNLPASATVVAFLVTSLSEPPPVPLAVIGMPGCTSYVNTDVVQLAFGSSAGISWSFNFPANPAFEGTRLVQQAAVLDNGVNAMNMIVSNPVRVTVGLQ